MAAVILMGPSTAKEGRPSWSHLTPVPYTFVAGIEYYQLLKRKLCLKVLEFRRDNGTAAHVNGKEPAVCISLQALRSWLGA